MYSTLSFFVSCDLIMQYKLIRNLQIMIFLKSLYTDGDLCFLLCISVIDRSKADDVEYPTQQWQK